MDSTEFVMSDTLQHWLDNWEQCLDLWLECGAATPSPQARQRLQDWAELSASAGWHEVQALAAVLLDPGAAATAKADALLDLLSWQQCARRIIEANQLQAS
ncbi:MAG: hypothetical protein KDJ99_23135 [Candidatus Competibacteraceae bacterium]|nr:hypothetical protein [Candidatus Competibacteraceae bacterium]MCB1807940.1 hypothetical protein [Candidatus Competibacteraceae bacterium]